jgi:hypothetical protein
MTGHFRLQSFSLKKWSVPGSGTRKSGLSPALAIQSMTNQQSIFCSLIRVICVICGQYLKQIITVWPIGVDLPVSWLHLGVDFW